MTLRRQGCDRPRRSGRRAVINPARSR